MNKLEIQKCVLQKGAPLDLAKFTWNEKTNTFSSVENNLVIDFSNIDSATIKCGYSATIDCGYYATIDCGYYATIDCGYYATIKCRDYATIDCGDSATIKCRNSATIKCGEESVIVNRNVFDVIQPLKNEVVKICPSGVAGYISKREGEEVFYKNINGERVEHIIADNILSRVVSKKNNVYKVVNHGENKESWLVTDGINWSHGHTIDKCREGLLFKISDRDTSTYKRLTLESTVSELEAIQMYRKITGACESQTKSFVLRQTNRKSEYTVKELIERTKGQYNSSVFEEFFNKLNTEGD